MVRASIVAAVGATAVVLGVLGVTAHVGWWLLAVPVGLLAAIGVWDLVQPRHAILAPTPSWGTSGS